MQNFGDFEANSSTLALCEYLYELCNNNQPNLSTIAKAHKKFSKLKCNVHVWQSQVEIKHYSVAYSTVLPCSKSCSTELPLRVGLVHTE